MNIADFIVISIVAVFIFFALSCQEEKDLAFKKKCDDAGLIVITGHGVKKYCGEGFRP